MSNTYRDQTFSDVSASEIVSKAKGFAEGGYRLVQICATSKNGSTEVLYSFDKDIDLVNLRLMVPEDMAVPSISGSYWSAFIFENEIHDLFGVEFTDLKLDYKGNFFKVSGKTPWKTTPKGVE